MINAKELRIGNYVKLGKNAERVYQIIYERVNGYSINHKDYKEDFFEPIELTEDILIKCGFDEDGCKDLVDTENLESPNQKSFLSYDMSESEIGIYIKGRLHRGEGSQYWIYCRYLHQLQNLYFALTGEELNIELNAQVSDTTEAK